MMNAPMPPVPRTVSESAAQPTPVLNEPKVQAGMHSLKVAATPAVQTAAATADAIAKPESRIPEKIYAPLAPKDALLPLDKLAEWPNLGLIVRVKTRDDAINLVKAIEADRGAVPPQALFLSARILSEQGMMEQAALYYFVGQLRLTFDVTRWPPQASSEEMARFTAAQSAGQSKSPDQRQGNVAVPKFENPHEGMAMLASAISKPILRWAMEDPARMSAVLDAVKVWDESAPYAYLPGYDVGKPTAFQDWSRALTGVRSAYFMSMENVVKGLKKNPSPASDASDEYDASAITPSSETE